MTDEEGTDESQPSKLSPLSRLLEPVVVNLDLFGSVSFGHINRKKFTDLSELLAADDDREFAIRFTQRLIVRPEISLEEWQQLSDTDLLNVVQSLGTSHRAIKQHFSRDEEIDPLASFRSAILRYSQSERERLQRLGGIGSVIQDYHKDLNTSLSPVLNNAAAISALANTWSSPLQEIAGAATLFNQKLAVDLNPMRTAFEAFHQANLESQKSLYSAFEGLTNVWQVLQPDLFTRIQTSFQNLDFDLEAYNTSLRETNEILKKYHWFISPSMDATFVRHVKEIHYSESHQRREMNRLFIQYVSYGDYVNLKDMFADWKKNPLFAPRMAIIKSSLDVLRTARKTHNPSNVVIPALLTQIDGIICDILEDRGVELRNGYFYDSNGHRRKAEHILKDLIEATAVDRNEATDITRRLVDGFDPDKYLLLDVLFQGGRRGIALNRPTTFSRHKIIHGESTRYGRMENTVRAFLILDYLAYLDTKIPRVKK